MIYILLYIAFVIINFIVYSGTESLITVLESLNFWLLQLMYMVITTIVSCFIEN